VRHASLVGVIVRAQSGTAGGAVKVCIGNVAVSGSRSGVWSYTACSCVVWIAVDGEQVWWFVRVYIALYVWGESETKRCVGKDTTIMTLILCGFSPEILEINVVMKTNHA
jgi:hypothetical protein